MKNKGFTLIELLAVIVILAIIALIATPIVLNIINNAKKESNERSVELYASAVKNAIAKYQLTHDNAPTNTSELVIEYDGEVSCTTTNIYEDGSIYLAGCSVDGTLLEDYTYGTTAFEKDSWETIVANVRAGTTSLYKVGDTKEVTLTGNVAGTYTVRIANTSTPTDCSEETFSKTACGFVIEFEDIITNHRMNSTGTNAGGWPASEMRAYLNDLDANINTDGVIYNALPEELKNNIIETKVVSGYENGKTENYTSTDKLYLLSTKEVYGTSQKYDKVTTETRQLDYYETKKVSTSSYSGAIKKLNGSANWWWLRSADSSTAHAFFCVDINGGWGSYAATDANGVAPAFRIG